MFLMSFFLLSRHIENEQVVYSSFIKKDGQRLGNYVLYEREDVGS